MPPVEPLRVDADQTVHRRRELLLRPFGDDVKVRTHQAPGVEAHAEELRRPVEETGELLSISVVEEDGGAARAARRDVEVAVGEVRARAAGHPSADRTGQPA